MTTTTHPGDRKRKGTSTSLAATDATVALHVSPEQAEILRRLLGTLAPDASTGGALEVVRPPECSFRDFCQDPYLDVERPERAAPLSRKTWYNYDARLRAMGYLSEDGDSLRAPDWEEFREFVRSHPKGRVGCEQHRKALVWYSAYCSVQVPNWARRAVGKGEVEKARRQGQTQERVRFFRLPEHLQRLVAADNGSHEHRLNQATFRVLAYTSVYVGPRGTEFFHLRNQDVEPERNLLHVWAQKQQKRRAVQPPEEHALRSMLDPTVAWYREHIRPRLDPYGEWSGPEAPFFLRVNEHTGKPGCWPSEEAFGQFLGRGIRSVVGQEAAGPHGFRRACATLRYHIGWSLEQVATFIGDTPDVIWNSYLDHEWLNSPGVGVLRATDQRPALPRLRPDHFGRLAPPQSVGRRADGGNKAW